MSTDEQPQTTHTALSTMQPGALPATAGEIRQQVNLIQTIMKAIFKKDTHFGIIKGCKHPSLYKPGSEVILTAFRIAVTPEVDDLSSPDERRYRVRCVGRTPNGLHVGTGIGECSSMEEKYKWRARIVFNGKHISLGMHKTRECAVDAYQQKFAELFGISSALSANPQ